MKRLLRHVATRRSLVRARQGRRSRRTRARTGGDPVAEVGFSTGRFVPCNGPAHPGTVPAGRYAHVPAHGHADRLGDSFDLLECWIKENDKEPDAETVDGQRRWARRFEFYLDEERATPVRHLCIDVILTHGREGAVSGSVELFSSATVDFCDIYKFTGNGRSAKIAGITSYRIAR